MPRPENGYRGTNRARHQNPEIDELTDCYLVTIPYRERMQVAQQVVHYIAERLPLMGIFLRRGAGRAQRPAGPGRRGARQRLEPGLERPPSGT